MAVTRDGRVGTRLSEAHRFGALGYVAVIAAAIELVCDLLLGLDLRRDKTPLGKAIILAGAGPLQNFVLGERSACNKQGVYPKEQLRCAKGECKLGAFGGCAPGTWAPPLDWEHYAPL